MVWIFFFNSDTHGFFFYTEVETKFFMNALLRSLYGATVHVQSTCISYMWTVSVLEVPI